MTLALWCYLLWFAARALAWGTPNAPYQYFHQPGIVVDACLGALKEVATFCPMEKSFACYCYNPACLLSMLGCLSQCGKFRRLYVDHMVLFCLKMGQNFTLDQMYLSYLNWTTLAVNTLLISSFNKTELFNTPVLMEKSLVLRFQESFDRTYSNYNHSFFYGLSIVLYWHGILLAAAISNWAKVLFPALVKRLTGPVLNTWRRYVSTPALRRRLRNAHASVFDVFDFLVPTRLELVILVTFLLWVVVVCSIDLTTMEADPVYLTRYIARTHYMADRTGIVVLLYMPLLILFSGRNNIFQWITRWHFASFICFHRWLARVAFLLVVVHALCFTIALGEKYAETVTKLFLINGIAAATAGGLIMVQGLLLLRRRWYEIFLWIHFCLAGVFVGAAWAHVTTFGYVWFYYIALAIWVLERCIRATRLLLFGAPSASVALIANETLRIVVPRRRFWKPVPGGHTFITFWRANCWWQSHPFTFATEVGDSDKVVLYCKVKSGVTRTLYNYLISHPGRKTLIRVSLEGPYGAKTAAHRYDSAVLAAGGNGIPGIYAEAMECALLHRRQRIRLFWIIREYRLLYWFYKELVALRETSIQTTIYVTRPEIETYVAEFDTRLASLEDESLRAVPMDHDAWRSSQLHEAQEWRRESISARYSDTYRRPSVKTPETNVLENIHAELSHIEFREGRPDIDDIVSYEKESSAGLVAFVACGHPQMVDDMRYAVVHNMELGGKRLDFFEQLQTWA